MRGKSVDTVSVDSYYVENLNADEVSLSPEELLIAAEDLAESEGTLASDEWARLMELTRNVPVHY